MKRKILNLVMLFVSVLITSQVSSQNKYWTSVGQEYVSTGDVSANPRDIIFNQGKLYICYNDAGVSRTPGVRVLNGNEWVLLGTNSADLFMGTGLTTVTILNMAFDNNNVLYVFYKQIQKGFKVVKLINNEWISAGEWSIDNNNVGIDFTGLLRFDNQNTPYILYSDGNTLNLKKFSSGSWIDASSTSKFVYASTAPVSYNTKEFDFEIYNSTPYVAFTDGITSNNGAPSVKKFNGTSWEDVGEQQFSDYTGDFINLEFDQNGTPYVGYEDIGKGGKATVKKFNGTSWELVGIRGFSNNTISGMDMKFDNNNNLYTFFNDGADKIKIMYMLAGASEWATLHAPISSPDDYNGEIPKFTLDLNATLYIAYSKFYVQGSSQTKIKVKRYGCSNINIKNEINQLSINPTTSTTYQWYNCDNNEAINGATNATFTPTEPGYYYCEIKKSDCSNEAQRTPCVLWGSSLGTLNVKLDTWNIYPNPANNQVTITNLPTSATISIVDLTGKTVYSTSTHQSELQINTTDIISGVYFVKVESNGNVTTEKLMINK